MQRNQGLTLEEITDLLPQLPVNSVEWCQLHKLLAEAHYQRFCELEQTDPDLAARHLYSSFEAAGFEPAYIRLRLAGDASFNASLVDEAIKETNAEEMFYAGIRALAGIEREINAPVAFIYFSKAAEQGYAAAQNMLGFMYRKGRGVPTDYAQAAIWFRAAAEQGVAAAQNMLGVMYDQGLGIPTNAAQAVKWFRAAAEQGVAGAQNNLGVMYDQGRGVPKNDTQAAKWYRAAAEQGLAEAQNMVGRMYDAGRGVPKDAAQAVQWYRAAAEQGYAAAQTNLGVMYAKGQGVPTDNVQAVKWIRTAAEKGYAAAQFNLGLMCFHGEGVPKNDAEAAKWFRTAAEQGLITSRDRLKNLAKQPGAALTTLYEYAALNSDEKNIQLLLQKDPNQCYDLIRQDKYLKPETRANYLKFLVDEQLKNPTIKLDEAKLIAAGSEVASFRFSRLIKGDNQKPGRIKLTAEEIAYQSKLLRAVPEGHSDYADAQLILSYFEFKNDINGVAWRKHFLNAQKADPKRKENNEFPELPEDIRRHKVNLAARRLIGFWRDESLKNLNDNTGTTVELKDMKAKKGVKK